jgi:hypothetical protein
MNIPLNPRPWHDQLRRLMQAGTKSVIRIVTAIGRVLHQVCKSRLAHALCYLIAGINYLAISPVLAGVYFSLAIFAFFGRHG